MRSLGTVRFPLLTETVPRMSIDVQRPANEFAPTESTKSACADGRCGRGALRKAGLVPFVAAVSTAGEGPEGHHQGAGIT